jgi:hypothetical protein
LLGVIDPSVNNQDHVKIHKETFSDVIFADGVLKCQVELVGGFNHFIALRLRKIRSVTWAYKISIAALSVNVDADIFAEFFLRIFHVDRGSCNGRLFKRLLLFYCATQFQQRFNNDFSHFSL